MYLCNYFIVLKSVVLNSWIDGSVCQVLGVGKKQIYKMYQN